MITTLAQWRMATEPEALPAAPVLERWVLESPWGLVALVAAVGVTAMVSLNRAGRGRQGVLCLAAAAAIGGGLALAGTLVTTDRERVMGLTRELVSAVGRGDVAGTGALLDERVSVRMLGLSTGWDKQDVLERVERYLGEHGRWRLKEREARVRSLSAAADSATIIRTQVKVWVMAEAGYPNESWWLLTWRRSGTEGAWRIGEIDVKSIDGVPAGTRID